jgi:hypothetical protein
MALLNYSRGPETDTSRPGIEPGPPHSSKELFKKLGNSYSEHLHIWARDSTMKKDKK